MPEQDYVGAATAPWWRLSPDGYAFSRVPSGQTIRYRRKIELGADGSERHELFYRRGDSRRRLIVAIKPGGQGDAAVEWSVNHVWLDDLRREGGPMPSYGVWFQVDDAVEDAFRCWPDGTPLRRPPHVIQISDWTGEPVFYSCDDPDLSETYARLRWVHHISLSPPSDEPVLTSPFIPVPSDFLDGRVFKMASQLQAHSERTASSFQAQDNRDPREKVTFILKQTDDRDSWNAFIRSIMSTIDRFPNSIGIPVMCSLNFRPGRWHDLCRVSHFLCFTRRIDCNRSEIYYSLFPFIATGGRENLDNYVDYGGQSDTNVRSPVPGRPWPRNCFVPNYLSWRLSNELLSHFFLHPSPWFRPRDDQPRVGQIASITALGGYYNGRWTYGATSTYQRAVSPIPAPFGAPTRS